MSFVLDAHVLFKLKDIFKFQFYNKISWLWKDQNRDQARNCQSAWNPKAISC